MEGAGNQGLPPFALGLNWRIEGREQAEVHIHRLEGAGVGVANVMDEGPEGGRRGQYNRGLTSEESNRIDPGQESASGRFQVPLHTGELSGQ